MGWFGGLTGNGEISGFRAFEETAPRLKSHSFKGRKGKASGYARGNTPGRLSPHENLSELSADAGGGARATLLQGEVESTA
jgi:hypothetical protein